MAPEVTSKHLQTAVGMIHYLESKNLSGDLLVLFHPYSKNASFAINMFKFLQKDYHLIAIDLPFHGKTNLIKPEFNSKDISKILVDIKALYPKKRLTLIGHSFGSRMICLAISQKQISPYKTIFYGPELGFNGYTKIFLTKKAYYLTRPLASLLMTKHVLHGLSLLLFRLKIIDKIAFDFLKLHQDSRSKSSLLMLWKSLANTNKDLLFIKKNSELLSNPIVLFGLKDKTTPFNLFIKSGWNIPAIAVQGSHFKISEEAKEVIRKNLLSVSNSPTTTNPS